METSTTTANSIFLMGANHTSAPMELREKLYIPSDILVGLMPDLKRLFGFMEVFVLSTCNRFELMGVTKDAANAEQQLYKAYMYLQEASQNSSKLSSVDIRDNLYLHENAKAIKHVYRVASSLDSLVLGETQITGQFKDAIQMAAKVKTLGPLLNRLSQEALATAKKVRTQTAIGEKHVSISHAALDLAKKVFGELADRNFLIVGSGEMGRIAAKNIIQYKPRDLFIANRTLKNAITLAEEISFGTAFNMDEIPNLLSDADIVISSTSSPDIVIDKAMMKRAQAARRGKPIILLDIALPRDIDSAVGELDDVYLFDIDDLQQVVGANYEERRKAGEEAEILIDSSVLGFEDWLASFDIKPVLANFREYIDGMFCKELDKSLSKSALSNLTEEQLNAINAMQTAIANKITADVGKNIKRPPEGFFKEQLADSVKILFPKKQ
jgi:glutamyl-tRNA reductase